MARQECDYLEEKVIYSTDEQEIGYINLNGTKKALYQKMILFRTSNTTGSVSFPISNISDLILFLPSYRDGSSELNISTSFYESSADRFHVWYSSGSTIFYSIGSAYPTRPVDISVIIQYTKS